MCLFEPGSRVPRIGSPVLYLCPCLFSLDSRVPLHVRSLIPSRLTSTGVPPEGSSQPLTHSVTSYVSYNYLSRFLLSPALRLVKITFSNRHSVSIRLRPTQTSSVVDLRLISLPNLHLSPSPNKNYPLLRLSHVTLILHSQTISYLNKTLLLLV